MDFHNMKRKQLQALCKKHNISANLTNVEMADKLSSLLKGKEEKRVTRGRSCLKRLDDENTSERESDVVDGKAKKVRFSPENETFEFVKSELKCLENRRGGRRRSVLSKASLADEIFEIEVDTRRVAQFSGKKMGEVVVVETKKGRKGAKNNGKVEEKVLNERNEDFEEGEDRANTRRSLRNKGIVSEKHKNVGKKSDGKGEGEMLVERNANIAEGADRVNTRRSLRNKGIAKEEKHENIGKKIDGKGEGEMLIEHNVDVAVGAGEVNTRRSLRNKGIVEEEKHENVGKRNGGKGKGEMLVEHSVNVAEGAGRVNTRRSSRNKGIVEEKHETLGKRNDRKAEREMLVERNLDIAEGAGRVSTRRSLRDKRLMDEGKHNNVSVDLVKRRRKSKNTDQGNAKGDKELLEIDKIVGDEEVQPEKVLRRSKRNVKEVEGSMTVMATANENEVVVKGWSRRTKKAMVNEACKVGTESKIEIEVNVEEKPGPVIQVEEPLDLGLRRSTRRKSVIPSVKIKGDGKAVTGKDNTHQLEETPTSATRRSTRGRNVTLSLQGNSNDKALRENESILQLEEVPKVPSRRSNKQKSAKIAVKTADDDVRNGKQSSELLKESRELPTEKDELQPRDNLRRSERNAARDEPITTLEGKNANLRATSEKEPSKQRRAQNGGEESADVRADLVEKVPKQSSGNASRSQVPELRLSPTAPKQQSEQRVRHNRPVAVNNPFTRAKERLLVKGSSDKCYEDLDSKDGDRDFQNVSEMAIDAAPSNVEFVMDNFAKGSTNQVLSNNEGVIESTVSNREKSGQKFHKENQDSDGGASAVPCDVNEAKGSDSATLEDDSPATPVDVAVDHTEVEVSITKSSIFTANANISLEINTEKPPENYMLEDNDEKQKDQLPRNIEDLPSSHLVEQQCVTGLASPRATDFIEANSSSHSLSNRNATKLQGKEAVDQRSASNATRSSSIAADHVSEDEAVSVHREPMIEPESTQRFASSAIADNISKDLGDDENGFKKDEEAGEQDGDEKECSPAGQVNEVTGNSAEKEHLRMPEDNIFAGSVTSDHVDEDPVHDSCHSMDPGETSGYACQKDGESDLIASPGRDNAASDIKEIAHDEDLANLDEAKAGVRSETVDDSELRQLEHIVGPSNSGDFQADEIVQGDGVSVAAEFIEDDETRCLKGSLDEHGVYNAHDPSERSSTDMPLYTRTDVSGSSLEAADMQRSNLVSPDVAAKFSQGKVSTFEFSSSSFSFMHMSSPKANSILEHKDNEIAIGTVAGKANSPLKKIQTERTGIGSEEKGEIHLMEVEELKMQETCATVHLDGSEGHNPSMALERTMNDSDGQLVREKMGCDHHSAAMGEDLRETEGHENCLGDRSQPPNISGQYNNGELEILPALAASSEGEQLRDLFATPIGVSEMTGGKENFKGNNESMAEAFAEDKSISLPEGGGSSESNEASSGDLQGKEIRKLFATPIGVSKTNEEKECVGSKSEKACKAFDTELLDVGASPYNNQETYDGSSSKSWQECEARNLFSTQIKSKIPKMGNEITNHEAEMTKPLMFLDETVTKVGRGEVFSAKESEYDQLGLLFTTPVQSMVHCKEGETLRCNQKMAEDAMTSRTMFTDANGKALQKFEPPESLGEPECGSGKVIEKIITMVSDVGNIATEVLDEVKVDVAVNTSTCIFSEDMSAKYEVSKEQMTADLEINAAMVTGTEISKEEKNDEMMLSSGTVSPDKEAMNDHSNRLETTPVTLPNDLNEQGQSDAKMSHDNVEFFEERNGDLQLMEIFDRSVTKILHRREMASSDSGVQENSVILHPGDETKVVEVNAFQAEETVGEEQPDFHADAAEVELSTEEKEFNVVASINKINCTHASIIENVKSVESEGRGATFLSNFFREDEEVRKESDEKTSGNVDMEDNVVAETNVECNMRILEVHQEQSTNFETIEKDGFVTSAYSQELDTGISDKLIQEEIIKACSSPSTVHDTAPAAEDEPAAVDAELQLFSGCEMNVIPAENVDNEMVTEPSSSYSLCLSSKKAEDIKESSTNMLTGEQSVFSKLRMLRKDGDLSSNLFGALDLSASESHEVLKESEVAAAIKEYIDSETNENVRLSVYPAIKKDYIHPFTNAAEINVTEHANHMEPQGGFDGIPTNGAGETDNRSTEEEPDGRIDATERKESNPDLVTSRGFTPKRIPKLQRPDATAEKGKKLFAMQRKSSVQTENARSIFIHGTPLKRDMKENAAPASKAARMGGLTAVRSAKRPALKNLPWK